MTTDTRVGIVGWRYADDRATAEWDWLDYSASVHDCELDARARHDDLCQDDDYRLADWAVKLDDGSIVTAYLA